MIAGLIVIISTACKLFFSCIFWNASVHKLRDLENFSMILRDYGVSEAVPGKLVAIIVATIEFTLATLLLSPAFSVLALQGIALLLGIYTLALLNVYASGKKLRDCGCGTRYQANQELTWWPIARNCILILMTVSLLFFSNIDAAYSFYDWLMILPVAIIFLVAYWTMEEMQSNHLLLVALRKT